MLRHLFAVTSSSLALTACVVQPPPSYYGRSAAPYSPPYYSQAYQTGQQYPRGWYAPTAIPASYTQPAPRMGYQPGYQQPEESDTQSPYAQQPPESYPPSGSDSPSEPASPRATFADETVDYGVAPTNTLHLQDFDAATPTQIQGARTITTVQLRNMLASDRPPQLVDVIGGEQSVSLPTAVWLRDAGVGRHLDDDIQAWFDLRLSQLTGHDKTRPLVFFCASRMCWLAHNATLRALDLGYSEVYWYRGGRDAWQAAGLPMAPVAPPPS